MDKTNKNLLIIIFLFITISLSAASGYQYVGDFIEKGLNAISFFIGYFVLVAMFGIFKGVTLFTRKQLLFLAYSSIVFVFAVYLYPYFKYSDQNQSALMSTFVFDLILNTFIFTVLYKEASNELSKSNR